MIYKAKKSPKKYLSQNFLKSEPALRKIIEAGEIKSDDVILEIGPGKGKLTEKLLEKAGLVIAVEKDRELFELLQIRFAEQIKSRSLVLVHDDILNFNISEAILSFSNGLARIGFESAQKTDSKENRGPEKNLKLRNYKIIANIPYNITGAILKKFLTEKTQPTLMVLMVQHQVAQRIVARDEKESILSISVKAYGEPKMIMKVPARYFSPAPKVDSAIISIKNISRKNFITPPLRPSPLATNGEGLGRGVQHPMLHSRAFEEKFWEIVKAGFAHKRKKLGGNLKNIVSLEKNSLENFKDKRAEDLSLSNWILLAGQ